MSQLELLNKKNNDGETPLLHAAHANKLDIIKYLISLGANLNHREEVPDRKNNKDYWDKIDKLLLSKDISSKVMDGG